MVPMKLKVALITTVALVLTPIVAVNFDPNWLKPLNLVIGLGTELIVGIVLGLSTRLLMAGVEMAGSIMGFQVGFGFANALDPVTQVQTPVFGQFLTVFRRAPVFSGRWASPSFAGAQFKLYFNPHFWGASSSTAHGGYFSNGSIHTV